MSHRRQYDASQGSVGPSGTKLFFSRFYVTDSMMRTEGMPPDKIEDLRRRRCGVDRGQVFAIGFFRLRCG